MNIAARWRALPFAVRLAIVLGAGVLVLVFLRSWLATALTAGLLSGDLLRRSTARARDAADRAESDADDLSDRRDAAAERAAKLVEASRARDAAFSDTLRGDLDAAGDDAEAAARRRLGL